MLEGPAAALTNIAHLPGPPEKSHALYPSYSQGCRIMVCTFSCPPSLSLKSDFNEVHSGSSGGKESAYNAGDLGLIPGLGTSPEEGKGYPLQYSVLEKSMNCIAHGVTKSWTRLSNFHFHNQLIRDLNYIFNISLLLPNQIGLPWWLRW